MKAETLIRMEGEVPAHQTQWYDVLECARDDRLALIGMLNKLEIHVHELKTRLDTAACRLPPVRDLQLQARQILAVQSRYVKRQEEIVYSFLRDYFNLSTGPSMRLTFWKLSKDIGLAADYMNSFMAELGGLSPEADAEELERILGYALQGGTLMERCLREEEELVTSLSEEVLTDLDYLFS